MLGVLPFVEELDFLCTASTAVPQHLPPCFGVTMLLKVSSIFGVVSTFYSDFFLAFFSSLSSCPMSLQAWGCAPLRWFLKPWVPTWPPLFDGCFVVSGQLLAEDEQHMMIIASQLDILKVPLNFWPGCPLALQPWMSYSEEEENITYCAPAFQPLTISATLDNQCSKIHRLKEHKIPAILSLFGLIHHLYINYKSLTRHPIKQICQIEEIPENTWSSFFNTR